MANAQFRILYREFLFRMVDLELLSAHAQGDMSKLFGQFASLFIALSLMFAGVGLGFAKAAARMSPATRLVFAWSSEQFLIATTMLVVGLLAVLSWDSTFPDRRDVLVLAPLPVRARTMFRAKLAALATALATAVAALHILAGLIWPAGLAEGGFLAIVRTYAAYWLTMLAAGGFLLCSILFVQGLAAQLPRRYFLRLSAFLQLAAFCLFVSVYFLQPALADPRALIAGPQRFAWLPSYWFLGLFQTLNGTPHPALEPLARRAWIGLAVAVAGTAVAFLLSYFRTLRKIVEEPDIVPGSKAIHWLPQFGSNLETAVVQFSIRSLMRSRLHRVILAFYAGIGFALTIWFLQTPTAQQIRSRSGGDLWHHVNTLLLASSILMLGFWAVGTGVVFSMPIDLRANWVFRITPVRGGAECLAARRRSQLVLGVLPVWAVSAALFLSVWPWHAALGHLAVLALLGAAIVEFSLGGVQTIPFTCSYLPGRSNFHMTFWLCIGLVMSVTIAGAEFERRALQSVGRSAALIGFLAAIVVLARWRSTPEQWEGPAVEFEAEPSDRIQVLGLSPGGSLR